MSCDVTASDTGVGVGADVGSTSSEHSPLLCPSDPPVAAALSVTRQQKQQQRQQQQQQQQQLRHHIAAPVVVVRLSLCGSDVLVAWLLALSCGFGAFLVLLAMSANSMHPSLARPPPSTDSKPPSPPLLSVRSPVLGKGTSRPDSDSEVKHTVASVNDVQVALNPRTLPSLSTPPIRPHTAPSSPAAAAPSYPPLHWLDVLSRVSTSDRTVLVGALRDELSWLESQYPSAVPMSSVSLVTSPSFASSFRNLGSSLTAAYFGLQPSFVVGVTGGSSTATGGSWASLLEIYLRQRLNLSSATLRNAAQGTTSQLVTAPCIHQLVGAKTDQSPAASRDAVAASSLDLLLWEFAMNDEAPYLYWQDGRADVSASAKRLRHRMAEMWMRGALQLRVPALGFLHLWDISIHSWEWDMSWLPDNAWLPTTEVIRQYSRVVEAFGVNVIEYVRGGGVVDRNNKTAFLADPHHPNVRGQTVAVHLLAHSIVRAWLRYLQTDVSGLTPAQLSLDLVDPLAVIAPVPAANQRPADLPSSQLRAACLTTPAPHFSTVNTISLFCEPGAIEWVSSQSTPSLPATCQGWSTQQAGKADPLRADRKVQLVPVLCSSSFDAAAPGSSMEVRVRNVTRWRYLMLDCGLFAGALCMQLRVTVNGAEVRPNVDVSGDAIEAFFAWQHRWDDEEPMRSVASEKGYDSIRICSTAPPSNESEQVVVVQRLVIWHYSS